MIFILVSIIIPLYLFIGTLRLFPLLWRLFVLADLRRYIRHKGLLPLQRKPVDIIPGRIEYNDLSRLYDKNTLSHTGPRTARRTIWMLPRDRRLTLIFGAPLRFHHVHLPLETISKLDIFERPDKTIMLCFRGRTNQRPETLNMLYRVERSVDYLRLYLYFKRHISRVKYQYYGGR